MVRGWSGWLAWIRRPSGRRPPNPWLVGFVLTIVPLLLVGVCVPAVYFILS